MLLRYINTEPSIEGKKYGESYLVYKWLRLSQKINKVDYIIYLNNSKAYKYLEDRLFTNAEIIYENEYGRNIKI